MQPPTQKVGKAIPELEFANILAAAQGVPEVGINEWSDIKLLDVRPSKGVTKIRGNNNWEVQVDHVTGEIAQVELRRSDLIEQLHDGSFFGDWVKLGIFFPTGIVLLLLWITGGYMIVQPYWVKWRRWQTQRAKEREKLAQRRGTGALQGAPGVMSSGSD